MIQIIRALSNPFVHTAMDEIQRFSEEGDTTAQCHNAAGLLFASGAA